MEDKMNNILNLLVIILLITCFIPSAVAQQLISKVENGKILIDGLSNDWEGFEPVEREIGLPLDRSTQLMEKFDVKKFYLAYDEANLYFLITIEPGVSDYFSKTQAGGYVGDIYLNSDSNIETGCKELFLPGYENITGYDYKIWIPTGGSYPNDSEPFAFVSYELCPPKDNRDGFSMSEVAEANSMENPTIIQFSGKNIEFSIPLKLLGIKHGLKIEGIFHEFANSYQKEGSTFFSFVLK
jgi:hypothetical protein